MRGLALATLIAASLGLAQDAFADGTRVTDPKGDTAAGLRSYLDIRSASAGHARAGRLKHVVRVQRATSNTARAIQVHMTVGSRRYRILGGGVGTTSVYRVVRNGLKKTGSATVRRRGTRISFVFGRATIGSPSAYRWAVAANPNPGIFRGRSDRAPNKGVRRHQLSSRSTARAAARVRRCGNLVITPQSGNALGNIHARGISCRSARRKLRAWAKNLYRPRAGPRGYRCRDLNRAIPRRVRCKRKGRRLPIISFNGGT